MVNLLIPLIVFSFSLSFANLELIKKHIEEGEFEEALYLLEVAGISRELEPEEKLMLAKASIGVGEYDKAEGVLRELLEIGYAPEEVGLTLAELYLETGRFKSAGEILLGLSRSPRRDYLLGTLFLNYGIRELAYAHYSGVPEGSYERSFVESILRASPKITGWLYTRLGYDTNPTVAPESGFISRRESLSYFLEGAVAYRDLNNYLVLLSDYSKYEDVSGYDTLNVFLKGQRNFGKIHVPVTLTYSGVGGDMYKRSLSAGAGYTVGEFVFETLIGFQDFYEVVDEEENRDGPRLTLSGRKYFLYSNLIADANLILSYENSEGDNWENVSVYPYVAITYLVSGIAFNLDLGIAYYKFLRKNTLFSKYREDLFLNLKPYMEVKLTGKLRAEFSYTLNKNMSNVDVYSYTRHIFSIGIGGVF